MEEDFLVDNSNYLHLNRKFELIVIGGSAGCLDLLYKIIPLLPENFPCPVVVVIHRKKHNKTTIEELLKNLSKLIVKEAIEKEKLCAGFVYFAPADYHLLIERDKTFSFDAGAKVNFSRPSIDVTFESAAEVFKEKLAGIILSGANSDGAKGLIEIKKNNGLTIVEDPKTASFPTMPLAAIHNTKADLLLNVAEITKFLIGLTEV